MVLKLDAPAWGMPMPYGDAMAVWVISSIQVIIVSYRQFILRRVQSAWNKFNVYINRHVVVMILLGFIWLCVVRTSALSESSIRQRQTMLPDVAERLVGSSTVVSAQIRIANFISCGDNGGVSCQGIVGCLLGAVFAAPASGRVPPTEREILTGSVGGYTKRLPYAAPHETQLSCVDLDPDEHNENAQCAICYDNIEERGDIDVLVKWNADIGYVRALTAVQSVNPSGTNAKEETRKLISNVPYAATYSSQDTKR